METKPICLASWWQSSRIQDDAVHLCKKHSKTTCTHFAHCRLGCRRVCPACSGRNPVLVLVARCPGASEMPLPAGKGLKNIWHQLFYHLSQSWLAYKNWIFASKSNTYVNLIPRRHSAEVWQTVGHAATPLLSLERHAVQAVLLVKALQAPQAMSSETQHACWRIWWWRRWCCICGAQKEIRRATRPAFARVAAARLGSR